LATKRLIAEQVLYRIDGGNPDVSSPVQFPDVYKALEQIINSMFNMRQFSVNLPSGETVPDGLSIATYTDITVVSRGTYSTSTLPVIPASLPKNVGIFNIQVAQSLTNVVPLTFIPLLRGQQHLLSTDLLLNNLLGQIGYTPSNLSIQYTQDITLLGITKVDMDLVVFEMSQYNETDLLPIPSNMEADIINQLVAQFSPVTPETGIVNLLTTSGQKAQ